MKDKLRYLLMLIGVVMVGLFVMLCGLGLSFGFYRWSIFGFFGALVLLAVLHVVVRIIYPETKHDSETS